MFCTTYLQAVLTATSTRMTRRFSQLTIAAIVILFSATLAQAQPAATGTIRGKVINSTNGAYLKNATITVAGTNQSTYSNEFGEYELTNIPTGEVSLKADYIGEPQQSVTVTVTSGTIAEKDFSFRQATSTLKDGTVALDPLVVNAQRYHNAQVIAIAEERNSINIKNVVSVDTFGDIPSGNVGEFVKFLPGVQVSYGSFGGNNQGYPDNEAAGISVRGFGPEDTTVLINGLPVSNASPGTLTRQVGLDQLSITNASRVELIKVATPDMPANSIGGQVNLITKSAFEYAKPDYSGRLYFNFNSLKPDLNKTPGPVNKKTYKVTPGIELGVSYPLSKTLGIAFTGSMYDQFYQSYRAAPVYTISGTFVNSAGNQVSISNPIISRFQDTDSADMVTHRSTSLALDWKPSPSQLLRANVQYSTFDSVEAQRKLDARPTIATGADWNGTKTVGTTANSTLDMTVTTRDKTGNTKGAQLTYELRLGGWSIDAAGSLSISSSALRDRDNGHYSELGLKLNPGQVVLNNFHDGIPESINTFKRVSNGGGAVDYTQLSNWGFDSTIAKSGEAFSKNTVGVYKIDIERDLSFLKFLGSNTLTFKTGAQRNQDKTEKSGLGTGYQEDLAPGKSYLVTDIRDDSYIGQSPGFGYPAQEWGSTYKLYELNQQNQLFATATDGARAVSNYNSFANQQKKLTDTKDGFYGEFIGRFFKDRLSIIAGARQENVSRDGKGPYTDPRWNYAKNPNGTLYTDAFYKVGVKYDGSGVIRTNANGTSTTITDFRTDTDLISRLTAAGVKFPDHVYGPADTSIESRKLNLITLREIHSRQTGKPSYSVNTSFKLTKKIDLKAAYSRSFGLPPLEQTSTTSPGLISGSNQFSVNENIPVASDGTKGVIAIANPNLKPQTSNNWDFEVSYYTDTGGKLSVSYYTKAVTDQIMNFSTYSGTDTFDNILPILGLNPADYTDWRLNTASNSTTKQNTSGYEFEVRQDFGFLGGWGKHFSAFASYAIKTLAEPATVVPVTLTSPTGVAIPITPTISTITKSANRFGGAGLQFSSKRFTAQMRGTYRNENEIARSSLANNNFLRRFEPAETRIDLNFTYAINKNYSLFVGGRDVFNASRKQIQKDDLGLLPEYARTFDYREFGVTWTVGVNGKW